MDAIIYVVSLSSYDQMMAEDVDTNRMNDALAVFEEIVNEELLSKPDVIVFLNKADVFKRKVSLSPIDKYFPDYKETKKGSVTQGLEYFKQKFLSRQEKKFENRKLSCHVTCCTDTKIMAKIILAVTYC
jgi:hypothetical protein